MKRHSLQGTSLSAGQRRTLEFQERCKAAFLNPVLTLSVEETLKKVDQLKEQGVKPEKNVEYRLSVARHCFRC